MYYPVNSRGSFVTQKHREGHLVPERSARVVWYPVNWQGQVLTLNFCVKTVSHSEWFCLILGTWPDIIVFSTLIQVLPAYLTFLPRQESLPYKYLSCTLFYGFLPVSSLSAYPVSHVQRQQPGGFWVLPRALGFCFSRGAQPQKIGKISILGVLSLFSRDN